MGDLPWLRSMVWLDSDMKESAQCGIKLRQEMRSLGQ